MGSRLTIREIFGVGTEMVFMYASSRRPHLLFSLISFQVWNPEGALLGKIFLNTTSANLIFAGKGKLVILAETKIYLAKISENTEGLPLDTYYIVHYTKYSELEAVCLICMMQEDMVFGRYIGTSAYPIDWGARCY